LSRIPCGRSGPAHCHDFVGPAPYSRGNIDELQRALHAWLNGDRATSCAVSYVNPHVFNLAWENPVVRDFLADCQIVAVDGLGIALAAALFNRHVQTRTVMTPLFDRVLAARGMRPARALLLGGDQRVNLSAAQSINASSTWLQVTASADGYQPIANYLRLLERHPDCEVVLIGMGSPRSEEFAAAAATRVFGGKLLWNIGGGTVHFYAGTQPRVPHFVSACGVQWLWRILHEPRIAPRYIVGTPLFLGRLLLLLLNPHKNPKAP